MTRPNITTHALTYLMLNYGGVIPEERAKIILLQAENAHRAKYDHYLESDPSVRFEDAYKQALVLIEGDALYEELDELSQAIQQTLDETLDEHGGKTDDELRALPQEAISLTPEGEEMEAASARLNQILSPK